MSTMNLREWAHVFLKQRDMKRRLMRELISTPYGYEQVNNDGSKSTVKVTEELDEHVEYDVICCINTDKNIHAVVRYWESLVKHNPLVVFVNDSFDDKWLLKPAIHDLIAQRETLEQGLLTLSETTKKP
jgi:hypothetical protein